MNKPNRKSESLDKSEPNPQLEDSVNPASEGDRKDPRELVENPAVAPQMINQSGDLRSDVIKTDD